MFFCKLRMDICELRNSGEILAQVFGRGQSHRRFSWVWILLTCLFRCSPLTNRFPQSSTSHTGALAGADISLLESNETGTLRPLDFLVRFGTGTGTGSGPSGVRL